MNLDNRARIAAMNARFVTKAADRLVTETRVKLVLAVVALESPHGRARGRIGFRRAAADEDRSDKSDKEAACDEFHGALEIIVSDRTCSGRSDQSRISELCTIVNLASNESLGSGNGGELLGPVHSSRPNLPAGTRLFSAQLGNR